jgi:hypothetical protein
MADDAREQIDMTASPARCFTVATAFEQYPEWTSDVKHVTVLERDATGRGTRVEYHVAGLGRRIRYVLEYDFADAPHSFSWSLVEGDMLRALDGRYAFTPSDHGTHVDYTLHVDLAVPMPGLVKRRASGMIVGNALRDLKRAVEANDGANDQAGPEEAPDETVDVDAIREVEETLELEHAIEAEGTLEVDDASEQHMSNHDPAAADALEASPGPSTRPHPDTVPFEDAGMEERPLPPPSILESVLTELLGAVPEVKDHVLHAADALLDAAKALVDAADRVVRQQRGEE